MDSYSMILAGLLSPDTLQRRGAEEQLETWKRNAEFGFELAQIITGVGCPRPIEHRHLCCTLLKQYVEKHWSPRSEKFSPPEPSKETKAKVRKILPISLKDEQKCIRVGSAYAIAAVAHYDWPDEWPDLFELVGSALKSRNSDLVDGASWLCSELVTSVTVDQMKSMENVLLPELMNLFVQGEIYSVEIRTRAVAIFSSITSLVYDTNKKDTNAGHRVAYYYFLHRFAEAFCTVLAVPDERHYASIGLKTEIIKAFSLVVEKFPKQAQRWVPRVVPVVGAMLQQCSQHYTLLVVAGEIDDDAPIETEVLEQLIFALVEFLHSLVNESKYVEFVVDSLPPLVQLLLTYIQIPQEKVEDWSKDVQKYVEEEDVDTYASSVRLSCLELLVTLCDSFPLETVSALCSGVMHQVEDSKSGKESGWKIREACYTAMSTVAPNILQALHDKSANIAFNIVDFAMSTLIPDMTNPGPIFLQGHAISFSGRIATALGPFVIKPLLELCSAALSAQNHLVVRVCAGRAFFSFCEEAKRRNIDIRQMFDMKPVTSSLVALGVRNGDAVLNLVFSTLVTCINASPEAVSVESKIVPLCTAAMLKYSGDPVIPSQVADVIRALMSVPACRENIERSTFPTICGIIGREDTSKLPLRLVAVCLEVLESIIRGSPRPLSDALVQNGFPAAVRSLLNSDDCHTLAAGRECVRAYISKAPDQVLTWNDGVNSGVSLVAKIISHLLSPSSPELSASMVGRLVFVLLRHASDAISPYMEDILRAVLCKLYSSELNCVNQSLIMVFAHLIHYQLEAVLHFLRSVPAPNGDSALHYVFSLWCEKQASFFGLYDQKLSTLALCKLFVHAVSSPDSPLRDMTVPAGPRPTTGVIISGANTESASIPLLVKIFQLVIHELGNQLELRAGPPASEIAGAARGTVDEDGDDDANHAPLDSRDDIVEALKEVMVAGMQEDTNDEFSDENDDPDVADDAISNADFRLELTNFLSQVSQQSYYQDLRQRLTESEEDIMRKGGLI